MRSPRRCIRQESPIAIACQDQPSTESKNVNPTNVANAPRCAFSSAYQGSDRLRQRRPNLSPRSRRHCFNSSFVSIAREELIQVFVKKRAQRRESKPSVAPSETQKRRTLLLIP